MTSSRSIESPRRADRRGIALVITLLMLSVVTITAVAFLAVSRRERASVATFAEQIDARYIAEAGLKHAQGRISGRMAAVTNRLAHGGFMVSTNYLNPYFRFGQSFIDTRNFRALTNVSYYRTNGTPLFDLSSDNGRQAYARMLGNLYYDPRPPVFVQTNRNPQSPLDFRFYLDLNRNGQFETNGLQWARDENGRTNGLGVEWLWGDPEWIGLLQHPDVPHSGTNHFVGRFAYVVVPTAQALDLNFIGNDAKRRNLGSPLPLVQARPPLLQSGFMRNQGVGSWELNPAGLLAGLNTNIWLAGADDYAYETNFNAASTGIAFSDAERLRRFRQEASVPISAERFFSLDSGLPDFARINDVFRRDFVDGYSDGPLALTVSDLRRRLDDNDLANRAWPGADLTNHFTELNDLFQPRLGMSYRLTGQYTNNAGIRQTSPLSSYDRHTFYRLISLLGTDSADGRIESGLHPAYSDLLESIQLNRVPVNPYGFYRRAKLNLNYAPDVPGDTGLTAARISNFRPWEAVEWFTNAAHRILLSEFTNGLPFLPQGLSSYVPGLGIHGAIVATNGNRRYLTNYSYDARVHRAMQVAANIYDGANNRFLGQGAEQINPPSVFRPIVYEDSRSPGILRLHGYQEILGGTPAFLTNRPWVTLDQATNLLDLSRPEENKTSRDAFNVFGIPWVVGAKKGLPNFNQALWQTVIQPTRRLVIRRPNRSSKISASELPFSGANGSGFRTEYQYLINVTNLVGLEAWNSYSKEFSRNVTVFANNMLEFTLRDETGGVLNRDPLVQRTEFLSFEMVTNRWAAREYVAPGVGSAQFFQRSPGFIQRPNNIGNAAVAVPGGIAISSSFIYDPARHLALPPSRTNEGWVVVSQGNRDLLAPVLSVYVTNSLIFSITDRASGRLLDFVTLRSVVVRTNVLSTLSLASDGASRPFFQNMAGGGGTRLTMPAFWSTNLIQNNRTAGIDNQMLASIGEIDPGDEMWTDPVGGSSRIQARDSSIAGLRYFLFGEVPANDEVAARIRAQYGSNLVAQVGFNPSPRIFLSDRRMANDPLVHYTRDDLSPGYFLMTEAEYTEVPHEFFGMVPGSRMGIQLTTNSVAFDVGFRRKFISAYAPWGTNANLTGLPVPAEGGNSSAFSYAYKDPQIRSSDDWVFPVSTNNLFRYSGIGQLGRIHRGTPWQTLYLKSLAAPEVPADQPSLSSRYSGGVLTWGGWAGNRDTAPTNDWKYLDLFTAAYNDNAARGQLGVNQTNIAAWSAVLSAVPVLENLDPTPVDDPRPLFLRPGSVEIQQVLAGYTTARNETVPGLLATLQATNNGAVVNANGVFPNLGSILQVPTLSDRAPFLRQDLNWPRLRNVSDEVLERLPQQILSLLRADEPRFVIYSYGQTLKPAPNAVSLRPGPLYGMTTNYTITGEYVTKTVLRLDGDPRRLEPVIEDQRVVLSNP